MITKRVLLHVAQLAYNFNLPKTLATFRSIWKLNVSINGDYLLPVEGLAVLIMEIYVDNICI